MKLGKRYRGADLFEKGKYSNLNICLFSFVLVLVSRLIIYVFYQGYAAQTGDVRGFLPALNIWDAQWYRGITAGGYTCLLYTSAARLHSLHPTHSPFFFFLTI